MTYQLTMYIALMATSGVLNTYLGYFAYKNRYYYKTIAWYFMIYTWSIALYCFGAALGLTANTLTEVKLWTVLQYLGMPASVSLGLLFIMSYLGYRIDFKRVSALFIIPLITVGMVLTNDLHNLYYHVFEIDSTLGAPFVYIEIGPWYTVHGIFTFATMFVAFLLIGRRFRETQSAYRLQIVALALGQFIPMFTAFLYLTGVTPAGIDPVPMVLWLSSLLYLWAIRSSRLFSLLPVAKDAIFHSMKDGVLVLNQEFQIIEFNRSAEKMLPFLNPSVLGQSAAFIWMRDAQSSLPIEKLKNGPCEIETTSGQKLRVELTEVDTGTGYLLIFSDVTEVSRLQQELHKLAYLDELTQLANRRAFFQQIEQDYPVALEADHPYSILLIDLDYFKQVNDQYGHDVGDLVLQHVTRTMKSFIPNDALFARYGGEEFIIALPDTTAVETVEVAEVLQNSLADNPLKIEKNNLSSTISIGISERKHGEDTVTVYQLISQADEALYRAKELGRNRIEVYK